MLKKAFEKYKALPVQVRASFWFLICAFLQRGISTITTPIFTRLLSTAEYGQYSVFNSWLGIITVLVALNLYSGVYTQGLVKFEDRRKEYSSSLQGLVFTLTCAWTVIYLLFHNFWNALFSLTTVQMLAMLVMIWATAAFHFWSVEQRVDFKYRSLVIVTIIVSIAKPVISIIFVLLADDKVTARILGLALVELIGYSWCFILQMYRGKKFFSKEFWIYALKFNLPLIPHYLSMTVLSSSDRIMINNLVGESEAGIYSLAYSISQIMTLFNTALMQTIEPWLYKKIKAKQIDDIKKVAYPAFFLIAVVNLLLIAVAPEIVSIFAPASYHEAIWVMPPVAMSVYFMFSYTFFAVFEFYYEKTSYTTIATTSGAVLNIVLNYIFINIFGYMAAGYTTLVCYMFFAVFHYSCMRKICRKKFKNQMPYSTKILMSITIAFMLVGFLFMATYNYTLMRYVLVFVIAVFLVIFRKEVIDIVRNLFSLKKQD
ncbi:MAG: oligosaccharide flippase family protein [Lachnospiraceae bacterium]|nr:oligosaccharide flippase family protein [Lachnospiraceae bacterium]